MTTQPANPVAHPPARTAPTAPLYANRFSVSVSNAGVMIGFFSNAPTAPDGALEPMSVGTIFLSYADANALAKLIPQAVAAHAMVTTPGMTEQ